MSSNSVTAAIALAGLFVAGLYSPVHAQAHSPATLDLKSLTSVMTVSKTKQTPEASRPQAVSAATTVTPVAAASVEQLPQPVTAVVQPGDTLTKVAAEYQTSYTRLYDANPQISHPDVIKPGDILRVPAGDEVLASRPLPAAPVAAAAPTIAATQVRNAGSGQVAAPADAAVPAGVWDRLAQCESGGNWAINTGNGYYGGLQFSLSSWRGVGGNGYPHQASKAEQIARAEALLARQGWGAWPACTVKLGLR